MDEAHAAHPHHIASPKILKTTFFFLTAAMLLTIFAGRAPVDGPKWFPHMASFFEQWSGLWLLTNLIALGIAVFKAVWVIRFFMGAQYASSLSKLYVITGFVGFSLMFILFFDYAARPWEQVRGWEKVPSTSFPRAQDSDAGIPFPTYPTGEHGAAGSHKAEPAASGH